MAINDNSDLTLFLKPFSAEINSTVFKLREFVWELYPETNELIYDSYNAVAFGWSLTEKAGHTFCSVAVGRSSYNIHFGFYYGALLNDSENILIGKGNQYRYLLVDDFKKFPKTKIKKLLKEAFLLSLSKIKNQNEIVHGLTIVKSVANKKRASPKKPVSK